MGVGNGTANSQANITFLESAPDLQPGISLKIFVFFVIFANKMFFLGLTQLAARGGGEFTPTYESVKLPVGFSEQFENGV